MWQIIITIIIIFIIIIIIIIIMNQVIIIMTLIDLIDYHQPNLTLLQNIIYKGSF